MPIIQPASDTSIEVRFGDEIDPQINLKVYQFEQLVLGNHIEGIIETASVYASLFIYYDPVVLPWNDVELRLRLLLENIDKNLEQSGRYIEIKVHYGGETGPDLAHVAQAHSMTEDEVIRIHSEPIYRVYMMGFTPGFAYLGEVDPSIVTPRLLQPRLVVPAGSVGIAGSQTGIYPIASPGGWQIIGRTDECLFEPKHENPFKLQPGDRVRFIPNKEARK